jgi:NhaP-type Na+/H+ and K+/H+ antiporter
MTTPGGCAETMARHVVLVAAMVLVIRPLAVALATWPLFETGARLVEKAVDRVIALVGSG